MEIVSGTRESTLDFCWSVTLMDDKIFKTFLQPVGLRPECSEDVAVEAVGGAHKIQLSL